MKLAARITLLVAATVVLFTVITSYFLYLRLTRNYEVRSREQIQQMETIVRERIRLMSESLNSEVGQLADSLFADNETTLASLLSSPPEFNTEVISFAERLRRRTTLDSLSILSPDGLILSDSEQPALYGRPDPYFDMGPDQESILPGEPLRLALKKRAIYGKRELYLRGEYLLKQELDRIAPAGVMMTISEPGKTPELPADALSDSLPLHDLRGQTAAEIVFWTPSNRLEEEKHDLITYSTSLIILSIAGCIAAGYFLSRQISRPLQRLRDTAGMMAAGDLSARVKQSSGGEVGELIEAFNRMAASLEENRRLLIQTEKIAAWQEIARYLAHEIKNPLTPIRTSITNLKLCMEKAPEKFPEIFPESAASILEEVEKLKRLADEFSRFARLPAPAMQQADLNDVIRKTLHLYEDQKKQIHFYPGSIPPLNFDPEQISQVVHNLVQNAIHASPQNSAIEVRTSHSGNEILLIVEDHGTGIKSDLRGQLFTPYFTTRKDGTGLGLAIVQRIVTDHKGSITVHSEEGQGTRFEIHLPAQG